MVCGSGYGTAYLLALTGRPEYEVVALLARGSDRSQTVAITVGLPLYRDVDQLPPADIACVALQAPAARNVGVRLLARGLHLVVEHPISPRDLEPLLACAAAHERTVFVNSHFGDLPHVQAFIGRCRDVASTSRPLFICAMGNTRSRFSLIDIVCRIAAPLAGAGSSTLESVPHRGPLRTAIGEVAGIPCQILHTGDELCSAVDDGSDQRVSHRVTVVFPTRTLTLVDTWGPVVEAQVPGTSWASTPDAPWDGAALRAEAVRRVVDGLARVVRGEARLAEQDGDYLTALSRLWTESR